MRSAIASSPDRWPPWRHLGLAGLALGLGAAPALAPADDPWPLIGLAAGALAALTAMRPRSSGGMRLWLACIALAATALGLGAGAARVAAIDAGALDLDRPAGGCRFADT